MNAKDRIILALDVSSLAEVRKLVEELAPYVGCFKVGLQLIIAIGAPTAVALIHSLGGKVLLDGKFCDIPNTVGQASAAAARLGVAMLTVHASSGREAMRAAVENSGEALVLAVTVLTSLDDTETQRIFGASSKEKVLQLVHDARTAGVDGIICSPQELRTLREQPKLAGLLMVTPGVRPIWAATGDQERIMTPGDAIRAGADFLVIGRPIRTPPPEVGSPVEAAKLIAEEIAEALEE